MSDAAEVVVIGAGVSGSSIAFRLAESGYRVTLLDRGGVGAGTSSSCDKAIILQSKRPGAHLRLALASRTRFETLEEELASPLEFKRSGGMIVIDDPDHEADLHRHVEQQRQAGVDLALLDRNEAREHQPGLSDDVLGAAHSPDDAEVNPLLLNQAFARAAGRAGARLALHTPVVQITTSHGHVTGVQTPDGHIGADVVINAAGPYAAALSDGVDVPLPIAPRRGVILIGESMPPTIGGVVLCTHYVLAKQSTQTGSSDALAHGVGLALGQADAGNALIGSSREFVGFRTDVGQDVLRAVAAHAVRVVPALRAVRAIRSMIGFRPATPDGMPIISTVPDVDGYIVAAGHEGDGIALSPLTGLMVRDLLDGNGETRHFLADVDVRRFSDSATSHEQRR